MKNLISRLLILVAMMLPGLVTAQTENVVTIGTGTSSSNYVPFNNNYRYAYTQMKYAASSVGQSGYIGAIAFDNTVGSPVNPLIFDEMTIWIGISSTSTFASTSSWVPQNELTQVFHATHVTLPASTGWFQIPLDNPYYYNYATDSNLVIVVSHKASSYVSTIQFKYTSTTNSVCYRRSDTDLSYADLPGTATGTRSDYLPNMKLVMNTANSFCFSPYAFSVTNRTSSGVSLNWNSLGVNSFQVATAVAGNTFDPATAQWTTLTDTFCTIPNLNPNTYYDFYLRNSCANSWSSETSLTANTLAVATSLPYTCDFEDTAENNAWAFDNSTATNQWVVDTAAHNGENSAKALYISNDNGVHNAYGASYAHVLAYRPVQIAADGDINYSFDWRCQGLGTTYYLRAAMVPSSIELPVANATTATPIDLTASSLPSGWIALDGGSGLNLQDSWQTREGSVRLAQGTYNIVFYWCNATSANYNPPAAIDNISITTATCPNVDSVTFNNIATTSADITIHSNASNPSYIIYYRDPYVSTAYDTVTFNSNTYSFSNLQQASYYEVIVSTICGGSDTSLAVFNTSFRTDCGVVDVFPWDYSFETAWYQPSSSVAHPQWPYCWSAVDGGSSSYYWRLNTSETNAHTGSRSLYFSGTTTASVVNNDWMFSPELNLSGNEELSFWMKTINTSSTYHARVKVMITNDTVTSLATADSSDFIPLMFSDGTTRTDLTGTTAFQQYIVPLTGYSGSRWIAFVIDTASYSLYLDDIRIKTNSNCPDAVNPTVARIGAYDATFVWADTSSTNPATSWSLYYGTTGFNADTVNVVTVYDTAYTATGLLPETGYEFYVVAHCTDGDDASATPRVSFTTGCVPVDTLPFSEDFESYAASSSTNIPCWTRNTYVAISNSYTTTYPQVTSNASYLINGTRSLYFYSTQSSSANNTSYIALPQMATSIDSLHINFNVKRYTSTTDNYFSKIYVGVMSNPNDITTFDTIQTIDLTDLPASTVLAEEVSFENYDGDGLYIAIMAPALEMVGTTTSYNYVSIDDIVVDLLPECRRATNVSITNITPTSAEITWSATTGNDFSVAYSPDLNFNADTCTNMVTTNATTANLSGLTSLTTYYVKIRTNCTTDSSEWSSLFSFATPFDCQGDSNIIATIGDGTGTSSLYPMYASTTHPRGGSWTIYTAQEMSALGLMSNNTINTISYKVGTTAGSSPIKIYMAETAVSSFPTPVADTMALDSMQLVYTGTINAVANRWTEIPLDSIFHYSGTQNLMIAVMRTGVSTAAATFAYTSTSPDYKTVYTYTTAAGTKSASRTSSRSNIRFNMCTQEPQCNRPDSLILVDKDSDFVSLSWQGNASAYQVAYGSTGFDISDPTTYNTINVTTNAATVTGLIGGTDYSFYVRALCTAIHDSSDWSFVFTTHTPCTPAVLPFIENFDSYIGTTSGTTAGAISPCEYQMTNNTAPYPFVFSTRYVSAPNSLRFYATNSYYSYLALPRMNDTITHLVMTFDLYKTNANYGKMRIGVMSDPSDTATFTTVAYAQPSTIDSWESFEVSFSNYTGNGRYITFMMPDSISSYADLDNIVVEVTPTCQRPINAVANNITTNSAIVSWTDRTVSPVGYELEYGIHGFAIGTGTRVYPTTNSYSISNLAPGTDYDVYVRYICTVSDTSDWSFRYTFRTECAPISSLPFTMDFENTPAGSSAEFPVCWTRINDATGTINYYPYVSASSTSAHNGSKYLYFYSSTTTSYADNMVAVLPEVNTTTYPINTLKLSFFAKTTSTTATPPLIVGVVTIPDSLGTFVPIDTITTSTDYTEYTVNLDNYAGTGAYPAIKLERQTSGSMYVYVDDISLDVIPTCPRPRNLVQTDTTTTTVGLQWTNMSLAGDFEVEYTDPNTNVVNSVFTTVDSATLTGLTHSSSYWVRVRAICGIGDTSYWSDSVAVITSCEMIDLAGNPYTQNFEGYMGSVYNAVGELPICWNGYTNGTSNSYAPHIVAGADSYSYTHGNKALVMTSGSAAYGDTKVVALPEFLQPVNTLTMSFWMTTESSTRGTLYIGYLDGTDPATAIFTPIDTIPASVATVHSGNGIQAASIGVYDTISFSNVPDSATNIAFMWYYNTSFYSVCIDDIVVNTSITCSTPRDVVVSPTAVSATLNWSTAANYELAYKPRTSNTWSDIVYVSNNNTATFNNLFPETEYDYRIRRNCDEEGFSTFYYGMFTTIEMPCSDPNSLQTSLVTGTTAQLSWTVDSYTHPTNWVLHTFNSTTNIYDTIDATDNSATLTGLVPNVTYYVAVKALCATTVTSNWSDTISFTTVVCDPVTNLVKTSVNDTSFSISWTAGSNNNGQWEVEYGTAGFGQGEAIGTFVVAVPNATITGLTAATTYDVHVRAICGEDYYSTWSTLSVSTTLTDISKVTTTADIVLYPNPATNTTTITIKGAQGNVKVSIVDMSGRTVQSEILPCQVDCMKKMNIENLRQGAYFVRVEGEGFNKVKKLIVK